MGRLSITIAIVLVGIFLSSNVPSYIKILLQPSKDPSKCLIYQARAPPSFFQDNSTVLKILNDPEYRVQSAGRLLGAVKIDTSVKDNSPDVPLAPEHWSHFKIFEQYLKETFPNVFRVSELSKVNTHGLILHWRGSDESLKPLLLLAHQDVVPVQKETIPDWDYPPFSGHYDGTHVYGRGALDCKNSLIALMEALELLASQGYDNTRSVVVALGFDEEISGRFGAKNMGNFLVEKFGLNSMYAIIDEGPGLIEDPLTRTLIAVPGTCEKGYVDLKAQLFMRGGHSSLPPDHGAIGIMGELAMNIEANPYQPVLSAQNPILKFLQCVASVSGERMKSVQKKTIFRADFDTFANKLVIDSLTKNKLTKYLIQTSQAVDVIRGGEKTNALPEEVSLIVNHRVAIGTTLKQVRDHFVERVFKLAKKYDLSFAAFGEELYHVDDAIGHFVVLVLPNQLETAPTSPSLGKVWEYLAASTRHVFENLVLKNSTGYPIVTAPAIMPANTDTKHYWKLTSNIYRFSPMIVDIPQCNIHSVNERMPVDGHLQLTAWYYQYIQNIDTKDADEEF